MITVKTFVVTDRGFVLPYEDTQDKPLTDKQRKRKERHEYRKMNHLCVQCGRELAKDHDKTRCPRCTKRAAKFGKRWRKKHPEAIAKQKAWNKRDRELNPEKHRAMRRRLYRKKQKAKLCVTCPKSANIPAVPGQSECQRHLDEGRVYSLAYYHRKGRKQRRRRQRDREKQRTT